MEKVLQEREDIIFLAVGPHLDLLPTWKRFPSEKLIVPGNVPHNEFFEYLKCADVVLDSFPMSGGTALLDAVLMDKAILSLECPTGQLDYVMESSAYAEKMSIFIEKLYTLLDSSNARAENLNNVRARLALENMKETWADSVQKLYTCITEHKITKFTSIPKQIIEANDLLVYHNSVRAKLKFHIPFLFELYTIKQAKKRFKGLVLFPYNIKG